MKLPLNLEVTEGDHIRARPSAYRTSLPADQQITAVTKLLSWMENEVRNCTEPQAPAEAEIGAATAREFLQWPEEAAPRIYTGSNRKDDG